MRKYLIEARGIHPDVVDKARQQKLIYSDARKNAVFVRQGGGVFIRSTNGKPFKLTVGKDSGAFVVHGDKRLFVSEASINALSLRAINPGATVAGTGGNFPLARIADLVEQAETVYLCFDNDDAGTRMIEHIRAGLPQFAQKFVDHQPPAEFKDWNDVLTGKRRPELP